MLLASVLLCYASHTKLQVKVVSPPEVSLGIHQLPADTHNGDTISIKDQDFIVSSLTMRWRLEGGKYKRYHHRLDVVGARDPAKLTAHYPGRRGKAGAVGLSSSLQPAKTSVYAGAERHCNAATKHRGPTPVLCVGGRRQIVQQYVQRPS